MTTRIDGVAKPVLAHSVQWDGEAVMILDRRRLPSAEEWVRCSNVEDVARAIEDMVTQSSGPFFAALAGMRLAASDAAGTDDPAKIRARLQAAAARLISTRPTNNQVRDAVSSFVARFDALPKVQVGDALQLWGANTATSIGEEHLDECRRLGSVTSSALPDGARVLTHCWADLYLIETVRAAIEGGKELSFICTETRPYLQGARLTAPTLVEMGLDVTLVNDGMVAEVMRRGMVDVALTAADRVTMSGHVINKVGTLQVALAARHHDLPYYAMVLRPDQHAKHLDDVPIELRDPGEVVRFGDTPTTVSEVRGFYPAFDATPPSLVSGVMTDRGCFPAHAMASYYAAQEKR